LHLRQPIEDIVKEQRQRNGVQILSVELPHVLMTGQLPLHHNDPFDRLLIAQAISEQFTFVSKDPEVARYAVNLLW
jgi:PIN domain nuclease of toxin-antitoxin system